jgi:anti-sigma factor RsiW
MKSQIHNLDRESLLVLYLAGELSAKEQVQVDAMLAADPGLRREYEELIAAKSAMDAAIGAADAKLPLPAPQSASARKVSAAIKQWHVDRTTRRNSISIRPPRRYGWLYTSGAVAAAILITVFVLWSRVDDGKGPAVPIAQQDDSTPVKVDSVADSATQPSDATAQTTAVQTSGVQTAAASATDNTPAFFPADESQSSVNTAEQDLVAISELTDSIRSQQEAVTP